jgi:hypothetical protein
MQIRGELNLSQIKKVKEKKTQEKLTGSVQLNTRIHAILKGFL